MSLHVGMLRIPGPSGDTKVQWDAGSDSQVEATRRRFDEIVAAGYLVFELDQATRRGRRVTSFDPGKGELRAFRPMVGG